MQKGWRNFLSASHSPDMCGKMEAGQVRLRRLHPPLNRGLTRRPPSFASMHCFSTCTRSGEGIRCCSEHGGPIGNTDEFRLEIFNGGLNRTELTSQSSNPDWCGLCTPVIEQGLRCVRSLTEVEEMLAEQPYGACSSDAALGGVITSGLVSGNGNEMPQKTKVEYSRRMAKRHLALRTYSFGPCVGELVVDGKRTCLEQVGCPHIS
ncbi:hypothetical protein F5Y05DRAFT_326574 [Hypoxylon sp. FL0543]|nr:hypothetical protein F5Y05DRAFT_326574 [Hypoxylon sp. FL0543]